jgi:adenylate kinase
VVRSLNAIIFGAPGSGKGTYASRLQEKLGVGHISMGDLLRDIIKQDTELSRKVKSYVDKGLLVPDQIVIEVLKDRLAKLHNLKGFILDGFPRTIEQAKMLESTVKIDVIILLMVPDSIIIERMITRRVCKSCGSVYNVRYLKPKVEGVCDKCGGQLYLRADDQEDVIKKRLQVYQEQTSPLLKYFKDSKVPFIVSNTTSLDQTPDQVVGEIIGELKKQKFV